MTDINTRALDRELKRGSVELLILSLLDARPRHGFELSNVMRFGPSGQLPFHLDSLYPLLYRPRSASGSTAPGSRSPTSAAGASTSSPPKVGGVPADQQRTFDTFVAAVRRVTGDEHA